jgi:cobalamin biosynthetic protein CobC
MAGAGALDVARRLFPRAPHPWLDLSTTINLAAYPVGHVPPEAWSRLPEEGDLQALEEAAGRRYGVPGARAVVAAPGTHALIQWLPGLFGGRDVRLLRHGDESYERAFADADRLVRSVPHIEALHGADVAIIVNPDRVDGRAIPADALAALAGRVGGLVVDEALMDGMANAQSLVPWLPSSGLVVLRSFGSFYGLAGLRLGFAILGETHAELLRAKLGLWPVSGPALAVGRRALADEAWLAQARSRLAGGQARLMYHLRQVGATYVGASPLFCLVAHPAAPSLFEVLAEAGILVKTFEHEPGWLRFGFPGCEDDWGRLESALVSFRYR